jgi:hypothetical protein
VLLRSGDPRTTCSRSRRLGGRLGWWGVWRHPLDSARRVRENYASISPLEVATLSIASQAASTARCHTLRLRAQASLNRKVG